MLNSGVEFEDPGQFGGLTPDRKCTDLFGLLIIVLFFGVVIGLTVHCIQNGDVEIITNGYDDCGNICGRDNTDSNQIPLECVKNMEERMYNIIVNTKYVRRLCSNYTPIKYSWKFFLVKNNYVSVDKTLLPYHLIMEPNYIIISVLIYALMIPGLTWDFKHLENEIRGHFYLLVGLSIFIFCTNFWWIYKWSMTVAIKYVIVMYIPFALMIPSLWHIQKTSKLSVVMQLYREAANAFTSIKFIWVLPLVINIIIAVSFLTLYFCAQWILSYSYLEKISDDLSPIYDYVKYPITYATGGLLIAAFFFICEFLKNAQSMIIGGCVAEWYFTRDNVTMGRSVKNLLRYHLGTVCWGSLILTVTYYCLFIRIVANAISGTASASYKEFVYIILKNCLPALKCCGFFTRNGFTMTAIYGCNFCTGTIRAHKLLHENIYNARDVRILGDLILISWKVLLWYIAMDWCVFLLSGILENIKLTVLFLVCCTLVTTILVDCSLSVIEVIMDTIFLCFCEDSVRNNGTSKPYYMSGNFAEFVENANKYMDEDNWNQVAGNWNTGPRRLY